MLRATVRVLETNIFFVFCNLHHYSDQCTVVTDFNERFEIVRSKRMYFKCVNQGHVRTNYQSKFQCFRCKPNSHHTVICDGKPQNKRDSTYYL